ncbi:MAG: hypothetical protein EHM58_18205 [Ignavibacteriae bacterium]|nr:MAG: hypothetical protein EHM58_18205 [Ignavibacteriota bacterium]
MKKHFLKILLTLLLMTGMQFNSLLADEKIKLHLHQPPPNKLGAGDLWKLDITNTANEDIAIYLTGTATEEKDGLIVEGKSKVFTIKPGKKTYGYNDLKSGSVNWKNKTYEEAIIRTGNVKSGNYTICVTAYYENGEIAAQESCIEQNIEIITEQQITLISPNDGDELDPDTLPGLVFMWSSGANGPFDLRIVELKGSQSPDEAIKENHPFFEQKSIKGNTFQYPVTAPKFIEGKKYVWRIKSGNVKSDNYSFSSINYQYIKGPTTGVYTRVMPERGVNGIGFAPPPGRPVIMATCELISGMCYWAQIAPSVGNNKGNGMNVEIRYIDKDILRFIFLEQQIIDEGSLRKRIEELFDNKFTDTILGYVINTFNIPNNIPYSKEDSRKLLSLIKRDGTTVYLLAGDYKIDKNEKYPFGYFDVNIAIDPVFNDDNFMVVNKNGDWFFTSTREKLSKLINSSSENMPGLISNHDNEDCRVWLETCLSLAQNVYEWNSCNSQYIECMRISRGDRFPIAFSKDQLSFATDNNSFNKNPFGIEHELEAKVKIPDFNTGLKNDSLKNIFLDWTSPKLNDGINTEIINLKIPVKNTNLFKGNVKEVQADIKSYNEGILVRFKIKDYDSKGTLHEYSLYNFIPNYISIQNPGVK